MPLNRSRRRATALLSTALAALTLTTTCGGAAPSSGTTASASAARASSRSSDVEDPCALLDPKEVEAALGAPLAVPPFLSRDGRPERDGSACQYQDAALHSVTIDVNWDHGAMAFKMSGALQSLVDQTAAKGLVKLTDGTELAGEWDEAHLMGCCTFIALRGDQMVTVDVGASKAPIAAAATLADAAIKRLEHRLAIDGSANVKPALAFDAAHRPARRDPCALVSRPEAEAAIGALSAEPRSIDPESVEARCVYEHAVDGKFAGTYVVKVRWTGGFNELRNHAAVFGDFSRAFARNAPISADAREAIASVGVGADLPTNAAWETAHWDVSGLSAVKKDVLVSIDPQGGRSDDAVKLMEKLMSKL